MRLRCHLAKAFDGCEVALSAAPVWIAATLAVMALQAILIVTHRPWLDEWQALQIALQSPTFDDLLINLRYEGHPALWYLILRGLNHLVGNPYMVLPVAAMLLALPVQATILFASPFRRFDRLLIAASEFVLFEFLTVSRSQTLGVACSLMVVALWNRPRWSWAFIALLPQCDFLFGIISLIFIALRWRDRAISWPFVTLWFVSGLVAAKTVHPMPDMATAMVPQKPLKAFSIWLAEMSALGLPFQTAGLVPTWNRPPPIGINAFALFGFLTILWLETRNRPREAIALALFIGLTLLFSLAVYPLSVRHLMLGAWLFILLLWLRSKQGGTQPNIWTRSWLFIIAASGLATAGINLALPFDRAPEALAEMRKLGLTGKTWTAFPRSDGQGVAALNDMTFERLTENCRESFIRWNIPAEHLIRSSTQLEQILARKRSAVGRFYLLTEYDLPDRPGLLHKLSDIPAGYDGQRYLLYVVGEDRPERPHVSPLCAGAALPLRHP
ncbi:hypothetical protein Y88_0626 [Novosphingobium nitrogenifigens DSM 19370]|uniref:Glycosyltransferase RgtA/B/C/D-like domain-containing protein n=2 Tax=Novosphingobium nitrogenifigens TaxID=378548 RepID=F1ZA24_9SPHN|nr:hypothetical protein Y88_0626 [Novosphingobium nitrogenifigens DSM 19370]